MCFTFLTGKSIVQESSGMVEKAYSFLFFFVCQREVKACFSDAPSILWGTSKDAALRSLAVPPPCVLTGSSKKFYSNSPVRLGDTHNRRTCCLMCI